MRFLYVSQLISKKLYRKKKMKHQVCYCKVKFNFHDKINLYREKKLTVFTKQNKQLNTTYLVEHNYTYCVSALNICLAKPFRPEYKTF